MFVSFPANMQRTFLAVKPDGVQRGLCGEIIKRFEQRGFRLVAAKFMQVTVATAASDERVVVLAFPAEISELRRTNT